LKTLLLEKEQVEALIKEGKNFILAGDERVLKNLPKGNWIAGTIPYFMDENGGAFSQDRIYVTKLPKYLEKVEVKTYNTSNIHKVYNDAPDHGFSVIIIPALSGIHLSFSIEGPNYEGFATKPLLGWISGVYLDELGKTTPKVFNGKDDTSHVEEAVVMHISLPQNKHAEIDIINIFEQGDGDTLTFTEDKFTAKNVLVNGKERNFADYIAENKIDTKLPLVADLFGANINTSFQSIDEEEKQVNFYAPVFKGVDYKIAKPVGDYVENFNKQIPNGVSDKLFFSCNCILNYLYAELEGKKTKGFTGPVTFGEVAYQLLNQTMVYLTIENT
jgi:hypothetical protein